MAAFATVGAKGSQVSRTLFGVMGITPAKTWVHFKKARILRDEVRNEQKKNPTAGVYAMPSSVGWFAIAIMILVIIVMAILAAMVTSRMVKETNRLLPLYVPDITGPTGVSINTGFPGPPGPTGETGAFTLVFTGPTGATGPIVVAIGVCICIFESRRRKDASRGPKVPALSKARSSLCILRNIHSHVFFLADGYIRIDWASWRRRNWHGARFHRSDRNYWGKSICFPRLWHRIGLQTSFICSPSDR